MKIEDMLSAFTDALRVQRTKNMMTLGKMIKRLKALPSDTLITPCLHNPHSYRGYYDDLAFEFAGDSSVSAAELLKMCETCVGETFIGYRGGEFMMDEDTPCWAAIAGRVGRPILAILDSGEIVLGEED